MLFVDGMHCDCVNGYMYSKYAIAAVTEAAKAGFDFEKHESETSEKQRGKLNFTIMDKLKTTLSKL